jgi:hypothetical protein
MNRFRSQFKNRKMKKIFKPSHLLQSFQKKTFSKLNTQFKNSKVFKVSILTTGFVLFSTLMNTQFKAQEEEEKVEDYIFKTDKLKQASKNKKAYVLVACGSFNPPTIVIIYS